MMIDTCAPDVKVVDAVKTTLNAVGSSNRADYKTIDRPISQPAFANPFLPTENQRLYTVAHDLRNPLGAAYTLLNFLLDDDNLTDSQREMLNMAKETTCYSLKLVGNLLTESRVNQAEPEPTDVNEIVPLCVKVLLLRADEKNQQLTYNISGPSQMVAMGAEKLARVIDNLVSNAIKFTPCGGKITVNVCSTANQVQVAVQDSGIGIPLHLQRKIFSCNSGVGRKGTMGEESFGLGLPICKRIIAEHNGKLCFTSLEGMGTNFHFTLPKVTGQSIELVA